MTAVCDLCRFYLDDDYRREGKGGDPHIDWRNYHKRLVSHLDQHWEATRKEHHVPRKKQEEVDVDDILDEIEDEELEDADELDEDDDPTEEKPRRKSSRSKAKSAAKKKKAPKEKEGVGTAEVADAAGVDSRTLRVLLRAEFPREEGGRYQWSSLSHPEVKKIIKRVKEGGAKKAKQDSLDKLKSSKKKKGKKADEDPAEAKKRRAAARRRKARAAKKSAGDDDE